MPVSWNDTAIISVHFQYLGYRARISEKQGSCSYVLSVVSLLLWHIHDLNELGLNPEAGQFFYLRANANRARDIVTRANRALAGTESLQCSWVSTREIHP